MLHGTATNVTANQHRNSKDGQQHHHHHRRRSSSIRIHDDDLLTRTSWVDARTALRQINKGKATGNKAALRLRAKLQAHLFQLGCFVQRHPGKVLFVGLLVLSTFCVGLKSATLETDVEKLWVEKGGRLERELEYVERSLGTGSGTTNQIILQTAKQTGSNILRRDALNAHLNVVLVAARVQVEMFDITWELKDLCNSPTAPSFDIHYVDQIMEKIFPCVTITPLDCFWEGSRVLGPEFPVIIPNMGSGVRWTTLNPTKLFETMRTSFMMSAASSGFPFDTVEDFMKRAGITTGYQEKPCLDPSDAECPDTAPNKRSGEVPNIGAELTGGCYGFATKYMHWPEDLVVGGTQKNKTGHLIKAEALQTVLQLMGEREMYEFWKDNYVVHNLDWSVEKAGRVLRLWQRRFTEQVLEYSSSANETRAYHVDAFSTSAMSDILHDFSEVSGARIALGYVLMLIYACVCLLRWTDPVQSQGGIGLAGVLLVAASVAAGLGFCAAILGIAFNASTTQIVPFLALGLGVDDMFLLAHTFAQQSNSTSIPYEEQTGECLKRTGVSVLLTSISNVCAFFAAAIIPVPALRSFALQAAVLVIFNLASTLLVFPAMMSLDLWRKTENRMDVFCCFQRTDVSLVKTVRSLEEGRHSDRKRTSEQSARAPSAINKHHIMARALPYTSVNGERTVSVLGPPLIQAPSKELTVYCPTAKDAVVALQEQVQQQQQQQQSVKEQISRTYLDSMPRLRCPGSSAWNLTWFARERYAPFLLETPVKVLAVGVFFGLIAVGLWGMMRVTDGLDLTDIVPRGTAEHRFLSAQNKYFGFYNMFAVTQGNFEYPTNQRLLHEYHAAFTRIQLIIKDDNGGLPEFWLGHFRDWLAGLQRAFDRDWRDGCINAERWYSNASDEAILAYKLLVQTGHVDNPIDKSLVTTVKLVDADGIVNPKAFYNYLSAWVSNDALAYSASQASLRPEPRQWFHDAHDVELKIPKSQPLTYAQMPFYLNNLGGTREITDLIEQVRDVCRRFEERGLPNFPSGIPFTFWEQYLGLRFYLTLALASVFAVTFLVISVLLVNPWAATLVVVFLAAMVLELFGFMGLVGIRLSAVPAVVLIVTVGIGMEFIGHVLLGFLTQIGPSRDRRAAAAIEHMFAPVVHGAFSTLLGVLMLALSQFDFIVKYFFLALFALMIIGLLNGLVLFPVFLSLIGPVAEVVAKGDGDRIETPTPEPSPQRERTSSRGFKVSFGNKRVHPRANSENSLTTITEEPQSWQSSSHEIVVHPEVVVETTTYPAVNSQQQPASAHSPSSNSSGGSPRRPHRRTSNVGSGDAGHRSSSSLQGGITTKVTATTKVKVEVHTPLPGAVERDHVYRHSSRKHSREGSAPAPSVRVVELETDSSDTSSGCDHVGR